MIVTDKAHFTKLAADNDFVPVARRIPADTLTPVSVYLKTGRGPWSFLFESVEGGTRWGRYSIIGFDPFLHLTVRGGEATLVGPGLESRSGGATMMIREALKTYRVPTMEGLPPFAGGLVGFFGYGAARLFEELPEMKAKDPADLPEVRLFAPRKLLAFDNVANTLDIIVLAPTGGDATESYDLALEEINHLYRKLRVGLDEEDAFPGAAEPTEIHPLVKRDEFEGMVVKAKEAIAAGEAIQIVVSQAFEGETKLNPFTVYRALRSVNPSPYLFHLAMGAEVLVGASPEVMVRLQNGTAMVRPIAGTRPRGEDPAEDARLAEELASDEKERAEHVMLVDLGRNDLGRVAEHGQVKLDESFVIERYSHVMHLVSTVSAKVREGLDAVDVFAATFPAGTVSGAPKVRAMQLIAEWEPRERGFYAGAVGYMGFNGNMDTCIAIRTMLFKDGRVVLQSGAGIVSDSDPAFEYNETLHKARALVRSLEAAARGLAE